MLCEINVKFWCPACPRNKSVIKYIYNHKYSHYHHSYDVVVSLPYKDNVLFVNTRGIRTLTICDNGILYLSSLEPLPMSYSAEMPWRLCLHHRRNKGSTAASLDARDGFWCRRIHFVIRACAVQSLFSLLNKTLQRLFPRNGHSDYQFSSRFWLRRCGLEWLCGYFRGPECTAWSPIGSGRRRTCLAIRNWSGGQHHDRFSLVSRDIMNADLPVIKDCQRGRGRPRNRSSCLDRSVGEEWPSVWLHTSWNCGLLKSTLAIRALVLCDSRTGSCKYCFFRK
jgi:hypothetical protein